MYQLLVGADGTGSVVRSALQQLMPANYVRHYRYKQVYSMVSVILSDAEDVPHMVLQDHALKVLCCVSGRIGAPTVHALACLPQ